MSRLSEKLDLSRMPEEFRPWFSELKLWLYTRNREAWDALIHGLDTGRFSLVHLPDRLAGAVFAQLYAQHGATLGEWIQTEKGREDRTTLHLAFMLLLRQGNLEVYVRQTRRAMSSAVRRIAVETLTWNTVPESSEYVATGNLHLRGDPRRARRKPIARHGNLAEAAAQFVLEGDTLDALIAHVSRKADPGRLDRVGSLIKKNLLFRFLDRSRSQGVVAPRRGKPSLEQIHKAYHFRKIPKKGFLILRALDYLGIDLTSSERGMLRQWDPGFSPGRHLKLGAIAASLGYRSSRVLSASLSRWRRHARSIITFGKVSSHSDHAGAGVHVLGQDMSPLPQPTPLKGPTTLLEATPGQG